MRNKNHPLFRCANTQPFLCGELGPFQAILGNFQAILGNLLGPFKVAKGIPMQGIGKNVLNSRILVFFTVFSASFRVFLWVCP